MKKRILALFLTAVLTFSLSSCKQTENVPSEVTAVTEIETIPVPEGGWTRESLNDVIYINGVNYEFPLTLEKLGEDYECDEIAYLNNHSNAFVENGDHKYLISFNASENDPVNNSTVVTSIMTASTFYETVESDENLISKNAISVNGLTLGSSYDEIFDILGEPNEVQGGDNKTKNENESQTYVYYLNGTQSYLSVYHNKEVRIIVIEWEEN